MIKCNITRSQVERIATRIMVVLACALPLLLTMVWDWMVQSYRYWEVAVQTIRTECEKDLSREEMCHADLAAQEAGYESATAQAQAEAGEQFSDNPY